jgi:hypothetical protein
MPEARLYLTTTPEDLPGANTSDPFIVLPSSGDSRDDMVSRFVQRGHAIVCLPRWRGPFAAGHVRLDRRVVAATHLVALVDLDRVGSRGPFVLDLLLQYVTPVDRMKILASPRRIEEIAKINLVHRFDRIVITRRYAQGEVWIETTDAIAGELTCLALSEDLLPAGRSVAAPWEDELVQRATELDLGVRYPGEIRIDVGTERALRHFEPAISALHLRLGIDISSR